MSRDPAPSRSSAPSDHGRQAYIKAVRSEDAAFLYPEVGFLAPGHTVYALHAADGTALVLTGCRDDALADAASHGLQTVSLH